ncbi:hypothetical protein M977_00695 [Buttiauxella gaviniae ATCC 51604]|uniref:O-antigen polymerase n=1 Tax=Buttiauxella gaviniae ATCC 51604 TaxID=1354253 RepID=A0A1B7I4X7_9ENTR|nr:hypothetical protein [Buttiauxella gaviniae]OAT23445.1 hypothetical protein M977_00695 [Buttiauxella gaviniae ATCC 51604]
MNAQICMTSNKKKIQDQNIFFCVLAAFFPLGSSIGVTIAWGVLPLVAITFTLLNSRVIYTKGLVLFFLFFIVLCINYIIVVQYVDYKERININLILSLVGCFYFCVCFFSSSFTIDKLKRAIDLTLSINVLFFLIQFISYYVLNFYLDYSRLSGGFGARNFHDTLFRASGIFNEPAEYSSAIICLISIRYLLGGYINKRGYLSLVTVAMSFSIVGIIQVFCFLFLVNIKKIFRQPMFIFVMIGCLLLLVACFNDYLLQRYQLFIMGGDGSNNTKIDTINYFLQNPKYLYGGAGLMGYDLFKMPLFFQGLYDLTFWGANITIFGVFGGLVINILFLFFLIRNFSFQKILIIMLCLLKINVMIYASYWFFILSLIMIVDFNKKNNYERRIY